MCLFWKKGRWARDHRQAETKGREFRIELIALLTPGAGEAEEEEGGVQREDCNTPTSGQSPLLFE